MAVLEDDCDGKMLLIGQNVYKTVLEKNLESKRKASNTADAACLNRRSSKRS